MLATFFLVEFFQLEFASAAFTSSGLSRSHSWLSRVRRHIAVSMVAGLLPSFLSCHAWAIIVLGFVACLLWLLPSWVNPPSLA